MRRFFYYLFVVVASLLLLTGCQDKPSSEKALCQDIAAALAETPTAEEVLFPLYDALGQAQAELHQSPNYTWVTGHLDDSPLPYMALALERNHDDLNDPGTLYIYGMRHGRYEILAQLALQYDNGTYALAMGKVAPDTYGLICHDYVGNHSGYTYAYGWDGQRLFSLIGDRRFNLFSATADNTIATNEDGVLYWSQTAYRQDSFLSDTNHRDTMEIYFAWDGEDSARVLGVERGNLQPRPDEAVYEECERRLTESPEAFLSYYDEHIQVLNQADATSLLTRYVELLSKTLDTHAQTLHELLRDVPVSQLQVARLNERSYLVDPALWPGPTALQRFLLQQYDLGYYVNTNSQPWSYDINYPLLQEKYGLHVLSELDDYMTIRSYELTDPCLRPDQTFAISQDALAQRLMITDNFITTYPYSPLLNYIRLRNEYYARLYFFGSVTDPHYDPKTLRYDDPIITGFETFLKDHPDTYLATNVEQFLNTLSRTRYRVNDKLYQLLEDEYSTTS